MKIRNGHVSNSSSSSFLIGTPVKIETFNDLKNFLSKDRKGIKINLTKYDESNESLGYTNSEFYKWLKDHIQIGETVFYKDGNKKRYDGAYFSLLADEVFYYLKDVAYNKNILLGNSGRSIDYEKSSFYRDEAIPLIDICKSSMPEVGWDRHINKTIKIMSLILKLHEVRNKQVICTADYLAKKHDAERPDAPGLHDPKHPNYANAKKLYKKYEKNTQKMYEDPVWNRYRYSDDEVSPYDFQIFPLHILIIKALVKYYKSSNTDLIVVDCPDSENMGCDVESNIEEFFKGCNIIKKTR